MPKKLMKIVLNVLGVIVILRLNNKFKNLNIGRSILKLIYIHFI
jgi:hypothetical protein